GHHLQWQANGSAATVATRRSAVIRCIRFDQIRSDSIRFDQVRSTPAISSQRPPRMLWRGAHATVSLLTASLMFWPAPRPSRLLGLESEPWIRLNAVAPLGTLAQVAEQLQAFVDLGVECLMVRVVDFPATAGVDLFAHEVMPRLRAMPRS